MSTVSWGRRTRYRFGACGQLVGLSAPVVPGVYAITYRQEPDVRPKSHTVLMFGEADDMSKHIPMVTEDIRRWWHEHSTKEQELFVFLHPMPGSTKFERESIQAQLVAEYDPLGNT